MLNANLLEKIFLGGLVSSTALFAMYSIFKQPEVKKEDAFKIRQELLLTKNVKMLYSTMSFFYLYGFQPKQPESFVSLQRILGLDTPHIVAVPLSKEDYEEKYQKSLSHPRFRDAMDRFRFNVKNNKLDQIKNVKDFHLKNLELLYIIDYCITLKKCKVVYARKEEQFYKNMQEAIKKLPPAERKGKQNDVSKAKIQDYTQILIRQMKPQLNFSLSPESPFKNIVGIIEPELVDGVSQRWKQKFRQNYSHVVMQDQEVLMMQHQQKNKSKEIAQKFQLQKQKKKK